MACERGQFSKKTHGDGAGIVRKLDANRNRIPATCASSGQSKRFLAALVLPHAPVQKNCMTLATLETLRRFRWSRKCFGFIPLRQVLEIHRYLPISPAQLARLRKPMPARLPDSRPPLSYA